MENYIFRKSEAISHIKNASKKSPTAEKILNYLSKTLAWDIDLSFINKITKQLIAKNKTNYSSYCSSMFIYNIYIYIYIYTYIYIIYIYTHIYNIYVYIYIYVYI